jgi:hypothetical protein
VEPGSFREDSLCKRARVRRGVCWTIRRALISAACASFTGAYGGDGEVTMVMWQACMSEGIAGNVGRISVKRKKVIATIPTPSRVEALSSRQCAAQGEISC